MTTAHIKEPHNKITDTDVTSAQIRVRASVSCLAAILEGRKPRLDPNSPETGWLYEQMTRLRAGFLLSEEPKCMVTLPGETAEQIELKGDTSIHPLGYPLAKSAQALRSRLNDEGLPNHAVLGFAPQYRDITRPPTDMLEGGGALILTKGDLYSLWQAMTLIEARMHGADTSVPIIINNHKGLWEPFLGFCRDKGMDLNALNIHRAETYGDVSAAVSKHGVMPQNPERNDVPMIARPGATILVQTSNDKKIHEIKAIFQHLGMDVQVLPFNLLVDKPVEAKELSRTYAGNNNEKRQNAVDKTDTTPTAEIIERLEAYGADPSNTFILLDDRGLDTKLPLSAAPEFNRCANYLNDYRAGPGVELGNVLKSISLSDFYASLKAVAEREGDKADLHSHDVTCYMMTPLFPDANGKRPVFTTFGSTSDIIGFEPRPATDPHYYSEHFLMPMGDSRKRTKMEIPHYIQSKSSMARAAIAIAAQTGMDRHKEQMHQAALTSKLFGQDGVQSMDDFRVLSHTSFFPEIHGHGDPHTAKRVREAFSLKSGIHGRYDYRRAGAFAVQTKGNGPRRIVHSGLSAFQNYFEDADAFILGPYTARFKQSEDLDIHKLFIFTSLVVGKQVFDPAVYPKFLGVFSHEWDGCKDIYDDFHRMGFIGQKPEHMFSDIRDNSKRGMGRAITDAMREHFSTYRRLSFSEPQYIEKGTRPEGLFRTTIYCSATSTDRLLRADAYRLAYMLAEQGFAVKNGGGTEGLMRMTSDGVHAYRKAAAEDGRQEVAVNAIISDQYEYTMRAEGLCDWNDHVRVHASIFPRIEKLQDTDAEIVLAGGAGTIQEVVASMITRLSGTRPSHNRPLVIVNQRVGLNSRGVYDKLLDFLPKRLMKQCNMTVVGSIEEAMEIVRFARHAMGMRPRHVLLANDRLPMNDDFVANGTFPETALFIGPPAPRQHAAKPPLGKGLVIS